MSGRFAATVYQTPANLAQQPGPLTDERYAFVKSLCDVFSWTPGSALTADNINVIAHSGGQAGRWLKLRSAHNGADLGDADATLQVSGDVWRILPAATLTDNRTVTIGTTNAVAGDKIQITRLDATEYTLAIVNGGAGAGTLCTMLGEAFAEAQFDGTDWVLKASSATSFAVLAAVTGASMIGFNGSGTVQSRLAPLLGIAVSNTAAIESVPIDVRPDGHRVYARSVNGAYRLDKVSTATADGQFVLTAAGGVGRWHSEPEANNINLEVVPATLQALGAGVTSLTVTLPGDPTLAAQAFCLGIGTLYHEAFTNGAGATYSIKVGVDYDDDLFITPTVVSSGPDGFTLPNGEAAGIHTYGLGSSKIRLIISSSADLNTCVGGYASFFGKYMS